MSLHYKSLHKPQTYIRLIKTSTNINAFFWPGYRLCDDIIDKDNGVVYEDSDVVDEDGDVVGEDGGGGDAEFDPQC